MCDTSFTLNNGTKIPAVGLGEHASFCALDGTDAGSGTWKAEPGQVRDAVAFALRDGYRHIDAALIYGNENEVGQGIRDSGVPRKDIFITSKLWCTDHPDAAAGLQNTLDALGTDYLDLYVCVRPMARADGSADPLACPARSCMSKKRLR